MGKPIPQAVPLEPTQCGHALEFPSIRACLSRRLQYVGIYARFCCSECAIQCCRVSRLPRFL